MAQVRARCDLMQNAFPAGPLSLRGKIYVVEDIEGEHMIFSVDECGSLCLVVKGANGHNELINLNESFALSDSSKITALAVTQSRQSLVHLTFAVSNADGYDDLYVMRPMPAEPRAWLDAASLKSGLYSGDQSKVSISDILMGNGNDWINAEYPEIYLTVKLAGKTTQDLWAITVSNCTACWKRELFEMACNPEKIVSKCIGNLGNRKAGYQAFYRGLFVLYEQASLTDPLRLRFYGLDFSLANPTLQSFELPVPSNARLLASYDNAEGFTDLLICADALLWRSAVDCFTKSSKPYESPLAYKLPVGEALSGPTSNLWSKQVSVAQAGDKFSLWTLDHSSLLSYQEFQTFPKPTSAGEKVRQSPPKALSPPIPLLDQGSHSDRFASIQNPRFGQKLFVMNENNRTMSMLQQSIQTRIWQAPVDVMIPDADGIKEFLSHTISIQVEDQSKVPLRNVDLMLCCSTSTEMLINGVSVRGSPTGTIVNVDEQGSLTVIIPSDGMAAPVLTIKDVPGSKKLLDGRTIDIDPMQKFWDQMTQVKTIEELRDLVLADGTPLVRADMSEKDLHKALQAIQGMCKARQDLASGGSPTVSATATNADRRWGALFRLKIQEAYDWIVEEIGVAYRFVVNIAGQVWEFIVENFPQLAAAMQKILEMIGKGWEWVKDKFEKIFPWKDILAVKHALVNITTAGVILGSDVFSNLEQKADECFIDLRKKVRDLKNKNLPKELTNVRISKDPPPPEGMKSTTLADMLKSPQMQYGAYHLRHSAGKQSESGLIGPRSEGETSFDRLSKRLSGILESVVALAVRFGLNVVDLFSNKEFGLDVLIARIGLELAEDALGIMQKAVVALLGSLSDLLLELADAMNADIKLPVIGPLYSRLTQGSRFSVIDMVCLLLAIPSTIAYKIAIGPLPKEDQGYQQLVKPNALKGALDLRMGRIKSGGTQAEPIDKFAPSKLISFREASNDFEYMTQMSPKYDLQNPVNKTKTEKRGTVGTNLINLNQRPEDRSQSDSPEIPGTAVDQAAMNRSRSWWVEVGKPGSKILQILFPVGSAIYTAGYKLPKAILVGKAEGNDTDNLTGHGASRPRKSWWKLVLKLVFWVGRGLLICLPKMRDMSQDFGTLARKAFNDDVFGWKFIIWAIPGFLPIGAHLINEYVGYCAEAIAGITQTVALIAMHIDVYAVAKVSYPWYRCPEEYVNVLAKVAVASAVMTKGREPYSLGFAFGLTGVGKLWTVVRTGVEMGMPNETNEDRTSAIDDTV
ncbi:MAG: hypothetical protein Q9215_006849 [Flavoplaca cf. flavocitrina]